MSMVVVGASLAGAKAVEALRGQGWGGRIVLIGSEDELPYERPPLSKDYLQGKSKREKVFVHTEEWYAENEIELRLGTTVASIDRHRRVVLQPLPDAGHVRDHADAHVAQVLRGPDAGEQQQLG